VRVDGPDLPAVPPATPSGPSGLDRLLEDDVADLYENAPCGYLSTLPDGTIVKVNQTFARWTGRPVAALVGARFRDLLTVGGRVLAETHMTPLLRMQGAVQEVALDVVRADGTTLPCLVNAVEVRDPDGSPLLLRTTVFEASARRRYERELLAAQRAAEAATARARTLQQVVGELATATTVADVARVVVERSRPAVQARGAALWLVHPPDVPRAAERPLLELAHSVWLSVGLVGELEDAARERLDVALTEGVRTVLPDARLQDRHPGLATAMARDAVRAMVTVPVVADDRRLGVLLLALGPAAADELISLEDEEVAPRVSPADVDLLSTLGRQAGQAVERARLHEETVRQAERAAFLLDAARLLAGSTSVRETLERLAALTVPRLADVCVLDLATEDGLSRPVARHRDPALQPLVDELRAWHLPLRGRPHPSVRALSEGRSQWVRSVDEDVLAEITTGPRHLDLGRRLGIAEILSVPLLVEGRPLGVLTLLADRERRGFTAADLEVAEQLTLQVALVVDRAQRYEQEVRTSHTLQASLLPAEPPEVPGMALAVRYLPATRGVEVGGDFYDVTTLPDGDVALVVGDVVGHDITAAATMGQLRSVHRALLGEACGPGDVVARLQAGWPLLGLQRMATALFGLLEPATGRLRLASAGHLPPLLVSDEGARYLPVRPGRMLGAPPGPAAEWSCTLPPGATLLLFTDGLVEHAEGAGQPPADLDAGLDRLQQAAAGAAGTGPGDLCDCLLAALAGEHRADDIALLALARTP
jgi:serine/threonine-protein kinase RsbW